MIVLGNNGGGGGGEGDRQYKIDDPNVNPSASVTQCTHIPPARIRVALDCFALLCHIMSMQGSNGNVCVGSARLFRYQLDGIGYAHVEGDAQCDAPNQGGLHSGGR